MKLQPLHDNVIVKPLNEKSTTKSGIVLPDTVNKEKPEQGEVIAAGPGKMLENGQRAPLGVKIGDMVMFKKYTPDEVEIDGEKVLVISESDIIAVMEK